LQTSLHIRFSDVPGIQNVEQILRNCVHCGFCNATCPTYLELGDERDGPRGRIYLIKSLLEAGSASEKSRTHLDRCLTCRACETTCPSGVEYGKLADFGRELLESQLERPIPDRIQRRLLSAVVPYPRRFLAALRLGRFFSFLLPGKLRKKIPPAQTRKSVPAGTHARKILLLDGCAQSAATPATNDAARRVLDRLGITAEAVPGSGCCGAMSYHLSKHEEARKFIRRNIDALMPGIRDGAEYVVSSASGCGVMFKDYGAVMADDPDYAEAARQVSERTVDLSELLWNEDLSALGNSSESQVALHCPCTLTHGLGLSTKLRAVLLRCGIELARTEDDHLCCGSAGTYSVLQPEMSQRLLSKKLDALTIDRPDRIVTANVGCQLHLGTESSVTVSHWVELLDR
jgi:glycolate oxidase iron-sulfur subunit